MADAATERALTRIGVTLRDKWHLDKLLGVGGMAAVYQATHRNGKRVAVKILHPELSTNEDVRGRFLREGYVANKIEHPGALSVIDDDTAEDGSVYLVMDLLEGETLEGRAQRRGGTLEPAEVLAFMDQLLDVLAAAHDKQVVHRDIKPDNVFLTREGQVKVLDFGIARLREQQLDTGATRAGSAMGTPAFMSPEQARGRWESVDARSDLWAVGASMYSLLTGKMVHEADTVNEQLLAAMTTPAPAIATLLPGLPDRVASIIDRALAFEPEQRWQDARAMQASIRQACRECSLDTIGIPHGQNRVLAATPPMVRSSAGDSAITDPPAVETITRKPVSPLLPVLAVAAVAILAVSATLMLRRAPTPSGAAFPAEVAISAPPSASSVALPAAPALSIYVEPEAVPQPGASAPIPTPKPKPAASPARKPPQWSPPASTVSPDDLLDKRK